MSLHRVPYKVQLTEARYQCFYVLSKSVTKNKEGIVMGDVNDREKAMEE